MYAGIRYQVLEKSLRIASFFELLVNEVKHSVEMMKNEKIMKMNIS